ncbi:MAG: hypothetical protein R2769_03335 [Saprospiraceae bacterium]
MRFAEETGLENVDLRDLIGFTWHTYKNSEEQNIKEKPGGIK